AVRGVRVARSHDVGVGLVNGRMEHESGAVHGPAPFQHGAGAIHQLDVAGAHAAKVHGERVGPEQVGMFRVAYGYVARKSVLVAELGEHTADGGQPLAPVPAFGLHRIKLGVLGEVQVLLVGAVNGVLRLGHACSG